MYTTRELLKITRTSPEILEWCQTEKLVPSPQDTLWLGAKQREYYPDYVVSELWHINWCLKMKFPLPTIRLYALGSILGNVAYEREIEEEFGKLLLIEKKEIPDRVIIDQLIKEMDSLFLNKYPDGRILAIASRYEKIGSDTWLKISRIVYIDNKENLWREKALEIWQPYYSQSLTVTDIDEITANITGVF
jgi:hypothetical protein